MELSTSVLVAFEFSRPAMGRKDKHKPGASRNNAVFKVVGAKVSKQAKGRPKGVDIKVKKVLKTKVD